MSDRDYYVIANGYIADVLAGKFPVCRWVKAACKRQVDDLARQDWAYEFDREAAEKTCAFLELISHTQGERGGETFVLEPWQCFIVTTVFGWRRKDTGERRFRTVFIECPKGNGKSFLSSGVALYMLAADGEQGAEILTAARTTGQAKIVFDVSRNTLRQNPKISEAFGLKVLQHSILHEATTSLMKAVSSQGKSVAGAKPYLAVCDELSYHRNRDVFDELKLGVKKRANSLLWSISTAGPDQTSVGFEVHQQISAILSGDLEDDATFGVIYSAEGFDWKTETAWRAANPNYGISVYPDALADTCKLARAIRAQEASFRTLNLCEWLTADTTWLDSTNLAACRDNSLRMEQFRFKGRAEGEFRPDFDTRKLREFVLGIDAASAQDMFASVFLCADVKDDGVVHYYAFSRCFLPESVIDSSPNAFYKGWARSHRLREVKGVSINYQAIEDEIVAQTWRSGHAKDEKYRITAAAFDAWQTEQLSKNLEQRARIEAVAFQKNAKTYSPVMDFLSVLVLERRFHVGDDPVLLWALSNVVCHRDKNENVFPNKASADRKIDAAVALLYALRLAMVDNGKFVGLSKNAAGGVHFFENSALSDAIRQVEAERAR